MFRNLDAFLTKGASLSRDQSGEPTRAEQQVAVAALLFHAALSSGKITAPERIALTASLRRALSLEGQTAVDLLSALEILEKTPQRISQFVAAVNESFSPQQKEHLLVLAWKILLSDRILEKSEAEFASDLRRQLNCSLEQAARARQLAELSEQQLEEPEEDEGEDEG